MYNIHVGTAAAEANTLLLTSPTYFCTSSDPMTLMKHASVRFATALASNVLPVPGGPKSSTPFGGSMPSVTNLSGWEGRKGGREEEREGGRDGGREEG